MQHTSVYEHTSGVYHRTYTFHILAHQGNCSTVLCSWSVAQQASVSVRPLKHTFQGFPWWAQTIPKHVCESMGHFSATLFGKHRNSQLLPVLSVTEISQRGFTVKQAGTTRNVSTSDWTTDTKAVTYTRSPWDCLKKWPADHARDQPHRVKEAGTDEKVKSGSC